MSSAALDALRRRGDELREAELARARLSPAGRAAAETVAREVVDDLVRLLAGRMGDDDEALLRDLFALEEAA